MGSEWKTFKVSDIADVIGGGTPDTKVAKYWNGEIPWLTPKDLSNHQGRYISKGERNISEEGLKNSSARIVPPKTVLLSSRAPVGYVAIAEKKLCTNQGFKSLVVKDGFDPEFVYYLLTHNTEYLKQHASGSTFQELTGSTLKTLEFQIPSFPEQRAIAHILGTLDDKIELNRKMNETLEAMARAIFKSWFVDFDPVRAKAEGRNPGLPKEIAHLFPDSFEDSELGNIPNGWSALPLMDLLDVNPKRSLRRGEAAPYLEMKNMPEHIARVTEWDVREFQSGSRFVNGDTLLARITPCLENGKGAFVDFLENGQVGWGSTEYIVFRSKAPLPNEYAYFIIRTEEFRKHAIVNMTGSSGRQRVPASAFESYLAVKPEEQIARRFGTIIRPLFERMKANDEESRTLTTIRDTLLPKLISGELLVKNVNDFIEKAGYE